MTATPGTDPVPLAEHPAGGAASTPPASPPPGSQPTPPSTNQTPSTPPPAAPEATGSADVDWKAEARKWEDRAKANTSAAEELAKIRQSQLTKEQQLEEHNGTLEQQLAAANRNLWKLQAATAAGLNEAQAARLVGDTLEELTADAAKLRADLGLPVAGAAGASQRPREAMQAVPLAGNAAHVGPDMNDWMRQQMNGAG